MKIKLFQSTLPVWGATRLSLDLGRVHFISIHAPRVGSDCYNTIIRGQSLLFQSTLPVWGATGAAFPVAHREGISIHAPRVGSDSFSNRFLARFNPRSPCGERLARLTNKDLPVGFQSTLPVWGATRTGLETGPATGHFNPRSPCGERPGDASPSNSCS